MKVTFDIRKSFFENLEMIHSKLKKLKRKRDKIKELLEKEEYKKEIIVIRPKKKRKREWYEKFRWYITPNGNLLIGGRDAKQNELLVKKYFEESDLYLHADIKGASSIIFKQGLANKDELDVAGKFAVIFSSAWEKNMAIEVLWTTYENVSLSPPSGEYREKGGVIVKEREYIGPYHPECYCGVFEGKLMCGPKETFEKFGCEYIKLIPGKMKKGEVAKILSKKFEVGVEDVLSVLPAGEFKILKES